MPDVETMIAVGDSVVWGQGLRHEQKFVTQVYAALSDGEQFPERNLKAHSGAVIGRAHLDSSGSTSERVLTGVEQELGRVSTRTGRRETPRGGLSILQQVDRLPYDYFEHDGRGRGLQREEDRAYDRAEDVELVVLDGGINDIGSTNIPMNFTDRDQLERDIRRRCYDDLSYLIAKTRRKFPNATIVVTSYFPFLSFDSDLNEHQLIALAALGFALLFGLPVGIVFEVLMEFFARPRVIRNVLFFNRRQLHYVRKAVTEQDRRLDGPGVVFATPGYKSENSTNASDAWFWPAREGPSPEDDEAFVPMGSEGDPEIAEQRKAVCAASGSEGQSRLMCEKAATFHPNPRGATAYANSILTRYEQATRVDLREEIETLRGGRQSRPLSVRETMEGYGLEPAHGARTELAHTTVDSLVVEIETGNNGTDSSVSLELAGESWSLDTTFVENPSEFNNFDQGDVDRFAIDPIFTTTRTTDHPLRLREIRDVRIRKNQYDATEGALPTDWKIARLTLWINGIQVFEETETRTLSGDDTVIYDYPS